jgi:hypothetical protein
MTPPPTAHNTELLSLAGLISSPGHPRDGGGFPPRFRCRRPGITACARMGYAHRRVSHSSEIQIG